MHDRSGVLVPQSKARKLSINIASLFSVQVANYLLPLLTVPFVSRIIGPERMGLLNFSQTYIYYFTLLIAYEFDVSAVRTIAANRDNKELVDQTFSQIVTAKTLLWVVATILFLAVTYFVPEFKKHFLLHLCTFLFCFGTVFFPVWMYQAMEDLKLVSIFNLTVKLITTFGVLLMIRQPEDYIYQNLSLSIAQIVVGVVTFGIAIKKYNINFLIPSWRVLIKRYVSNSTLFFSSIATTLYTASSVFLLGLLSSDYNVGIYTAGSRLETIVRSFVTLALGQALFPLVVSSFGVSKENGLLSVQKIFFPLLVITSIASMCIWLIAPTFITVLYGDKFIEAIRVLRIVAVLPIVIGAGRLFGVHTMLNFHYDKAFFSITLFGAFVGIALNIFMIKEMNFIGAAYAWVFTEVLVSTTMWAFLTYKGIPVISWRAVEYLVPMIKKKVSFLK